MLNTLGDKLDFFVQRMFVSLLQAISLFLWCSGWFMARAGPLLSSASDKVKVYADTRNESLKGRPTPFNSSSKSETTSFNDKIAKPPQPEAQPGEGESKIQIKEPLSTVISVSGNTEEVTTVDQSVEEPSADEKPKSIGDLIKEQIVNDERHLQ